MMPQGSIADLVATVQAGELICFPTDTVVALAASPTAASAIYAAKQRSPDKPLILMAATAEDLWPFVQGTPTDHRIWQAVVAQYWPGALTLVLPRSDRVPPNLNPTQPNIGIRIPNWPLAQAILAQTGPLVTTSLNLSGHPPLEQLEEIATEFPAVVKPPADQWELPPVGDRIPSTVAQWTDQGWLILRQGAITL